MRKLFFAFLLLTTLHFNAQSPEKWSSSEIFQQIKKLNFLGSVLYIAAHPDDENTRLISYFSNEKYARTAYLSMTRGDGGQNLIGPELRAQLGLIRTQELLAARRIDGGQQFFTRANDFGYSKNPEETLEIWDKEEVLSDVVWIIRNFKPDVIINRFDHRTPGSTHGHHTSSAILSVEAFDLAANEDIYTSQLELVDTHQPKRLFFNTSPWFYGGEEAFQDADKSRFLSFDTGVYFPLRGLSNPEIAALSRSQHRSQGFGSTGSRGKQLEYLELLKGEIAVNEDPFSGIDTSWNRVKGGSEIGEILNGVEENFSFQDPSKSLPGLLKAYRLIQNLEDEHWRKIKTEEIKKIIYAVSGLYLEAVAEKNSAIPGEELNVMLEAINRSDASLILNTVDLSPNNSEIHPNQLLQNNEGWNMTMSFKIPGQTDYSSPYWLQEKSNMGMYTVNDQKLRGLPENPLQYKAVFSVSLDGIPIKFEKPIVYKYNDNVYGETYQKFEIVPPLNIEFSDEVLIFNNEKAREVTVKVTALQDPIEGVLKLEAENGWKIEPVHNGFRIGQKGGTELLNFKIFPPKNESQVQLKASASINGTQYNKKLVEINYEHFPDQNLLVPAELKLVKLNIEKKGEHIGYIEGAGDVVPENLEQIGYKVTKLPAASITSESLKIFDAVVIGIRAFNVVEELKLKQKELFTYVQNGGTVIVQYNTSRGLVTSDLAPFNLELSRDRVTDENSDVTFLTPDHPVLNTPNKLTEADFKNWVQERGLYFPRSWSEEFTPVLSMNDKGETPKTGSLLVAKYGKGYYIYTGISFFRQFPEAVPGAFRLFANLISIGK